MAGADEVSWWCSERAAAFPQATSSAGRLGENLRMKANAQNGSEFHSQREYAPGDDLRRINWKTTARFGDLIVRETAQEGIRHCTVVLDTMADGYDEDAFERAVTAAASVVATAAAAGITTRLVAPDIDLRGPDVAPQSMRWLATVERGGSPSTTPRAARAATASACLVVVRATPTRCRRCHRRRRRLPTTCW
jgi:hypothetical protein